MTEKKGLSHSAYGGINGEDYIPYVPVTQAMPELTVVSIFMGCLFAVIFGAANTYLGLKVGMTIAAGIPAAILATGILKGIFKRNNILESNMIQAMASMGESLAGGLIFIVPAVILLGTKLTIMTIIVLSILGGLLGILFVVPLRKYLIVEEHGRLVYPEGMAASEVLVSGSAGGHGLKTMLTGLSVGGGYKLLSGGFMLWTEEPSWTIKPLQGTVFGADVLASLIGVGFIVGIEIGMYMFAGALVAWFGLIPLIKYVGAGLTTPLFPSADLIKDMDAVTIWNKYIRYVGAGAVAAGGFISIIKALPTIIKSFKSAMGGLGAKVSSQKRTDIDVPMLWVIGAAIFVFILTWLVPFVPNIAVGPVGAILAVIFAFFFAVVSARLVGIIGTSNNPISGMTIATLLFITAILKASGKVGNEGMIAAILAGSIVCVATAIAGGAAQSLKTTFIIGGTPKRLELAMIAAVAASAGAVGYIIILLDKAYGVGTKAVPAPQATLMSMVVKGIMSSQLPWALVVIGITFGVMCELMKIPVLPFALGLYLPIYLSTGVLIGGIVRVLVDKKFKNRDAQLKEQTEKGILLASGLVAGDALVGIVIAVFAIFKIDKAVAFGPKLFGDAASSPWPAAVIVTLLCIWIYKYTIKVDNKVD
ncbi:MAG: putative oligopeptide transporter, family [Clostridiaceae bacterium]|jgi:putative OPT family oligopeptide transporter|nr:putative oligopeptide transporter, family [Clostridiaceae bacterium]